MWADLAFPFLAFILFDEFFFVQWRKCPIPPWHTGHHRLHGAPPTKHDFPSLIVYTYVCDAVLIHVVDIFLILALFCFSDVHWFLGQNVETMVHRYTVCLPLKLYSCFFCSFVCEGGSVCVSVCVFVCIHMRENRWMNEVSFTKVMD